MDEVRAGIEAKVRATYAARLERELVESERELHRAYDERIETAVSEAVQEAVASAEWEAYVDAQADWEPYLLANIEDRADAIRASYEELIQQEVETRLAARGQRRRLRPEGGEPAALAPFSRPGTADEWR